MGSAYSFQPSATDADGDTLTFRVTNKPAWAQFDTSNGRLSGTPSAAGASTGIVIDVTDSKARVALPSFTLTVTAATSGTIAERHPGDVGIESDPDVVFNDNFEAASVSALIARYNDVTNSAGITLVNDKPGASQGTKSMRLTSGVSSDTAHVFKALSGGYDEIFVRYYIKYNGNGPWSHSGLWIGGANPAITFPSPNAGTKPSGSDRFSLGLEPGPTAGLLDFYAYWMKMHSWRSNPTGAAGDYYGNAMVHSTDLPIESDAWICYEMHLKLNPNPASNLDAVLEVWRNDALIRRYDNTGPMGYWVADKFCPDGTTSSACAPYRPSNPTLVPLDQQWRNTSALKITYIWPQHFNSSGTNSSLQFDDLVVARSRVGCIR